MLVFAIVSLTAPSLRRTAQRPSKVSLLNEGQQETSVELMAIVARLRQLSLRF